MAALIVTRWEGEFDVDHTRRVLDGEEPLPVSTFESPEAAAAADAAERQRHPQPVEAVPASITDL